MIDDIKTALKLGKIKGAKKLLEIFYNQEHKKAWLKEKEKEYESLGYWHEVVIKEADPDDENSKDVLELQLEEGKPTFNEWLNETRIIQDEVKKDGVVIKKEITELVRPYIKASKKEIQSKINTFLIPYRLKKLQKIFVEKFKGIEKIVMQKEGDMEYLQVQAKVYDLLYRFSKDGQIPKSRGEAYIKANEAGAEQYSRVVETLNDARAYIEKEIRAGHNADKLLAKAETISKEDLAVIKPNTTPKTALKKLLGIDG